MLQMRDRQTNKGRKSLRCIQCTKLHQVHAGNHCAKSVYLPGPLRPALWYANMNYRSTEIQMNWGTRCLAEQSTTSQDAADQSDHLGQHRLGLVHVSNTDAQTHTHRHTDGSARKCADEEWPLRPQHRPPSSLGPPGAIWPLHSSRPPWHCSSAAWPPWPLCAVARSPPWPLAKSATRRFGGILGSPDMQ